MNHATGRLRIHKFAVMFPMASGDERRTLKEDIRRHGVKVPVVLFNGEILDGRSRYEIARELGEPVPTEDFRGTAKQALELAVSYNLYRRHLNQSQKAMVAAEIAMALQELDHMPAPEARQAAAQATGASPSTVERAERIAKRMPEVAREIRNGDTTVGAFLGRSTTKCPRCGHEW